MSPKTSTTIDIVEKVSEIEEQDPTDLPPLYNSVNPDVFDQLSDSNKIQFEYFGHEITIESGDIFIDQ